MIGPKFIQQYKPIPGLLPGSGISQPSTSQAVRLPDTESPFHALSSPDSPIPTRNIDQSQNDDVEALVQRIESSHTDITAGYDTWLSILFAIADQFGETGRDYAHRVSCFNPGYSYAECNKQFDNCLRSGKSGITIRTLFHFANLQGIHLNKSSERSPYSDERSIDLPCSVSSNPQFYTEPSRSAEIHNPQLQVLPFPVHVFPACVADFITSAAKSINCPPDFIAVPALTVLATAIGTSCSIQLKKGWIEGPHIFSAVVALPGSKKSPALSAATAPIRDIQHTYCIVYENLEKEYNLKVSAYDIQTELWKKRKPEDKLPEDQPEQPIEPILKQVKTSNATMEAISKLVDQNKRGIFFEQDELAAWVKSMNAYRGGKGSDLENWLSFWNGSQAIINRAGAKKPLILDHPLVNVTGCIQPDLLSDLSGIKQNGFFDRILPSFPEPIPQRYTTDELPDEIAAEYNELVKALFSLQPAIDEDGTEMPVLMHFTIPSRLEWEKWNQLHDAEMNDPDLPYYLLGVWSKLQAYMARFILILHLAENAGVQECLIHPQSIMAAAELIRYFKSHIRKVYKEMFNSEMDRKVVLTVAWIRQHNGSVTRRMMLNNNVGKCTSSQQVDELLRELTDRKLGFVTKTNPEGGGRETVTFSLMNPAIGLKSI